MVGRPIKPGHVGRGASGHGWTRVRDASGHAWTPEGIVMVDKAIGVPEHWHNQGVWE